MGKALRWFGLGLGGLLALLLVAALVVFVMSEVALREEHRAEAETLAAPTPAQIADAPRQARILGCVSCHGEGATGRVMFDAPPVAKVIAPNLSRIAALASDQQLAAAIRQGIGHDGRALFVMPSPMFSRQSDSEVAALVHWMRGLPRSDGPVDPPTVRPLGRLLLVTGKFPPVTELLPNAKSQYPIDVGAAHAAGRRLAAKTCSECHGFALQGGGVAGQETPDLSIVGGYDAEQFRTLLRTGKAPSGKPLGLMEEVARKGFSQFTDSEIDALYSYLTARAKKTGG